METTQLTKQEMLPAKTMDFLEEVKDNTKAAKTRKVAVVLETYQRTNSKNIEPIHKMDPNVWGVLMVGSGSIAFVISFLAMGSLQSILSVPVILTSIAISTLLGITVPYLCGKNNTKKLNANRKVMLDGWFAQKSKELQSTCQKLQQLAAHVPETLGRKNIIKASKTALLTGNSLLADMQQITISLTGYLNYTIDPSLETLSKAHERLSSLKDNWEETTLSLQKAEKTVEKLANLTRSQVMHDELNKALGESINSNIDSKATVAQEMLSAIESTSSAFTKALKELQDYQV